MLGIGTAGRRWAPWSVIDGSGGRRVAAAVGHGSRGKVVEGGEHSVEDVLACCCDQARSWCLRESSPLHLSSFTPERHGQLGEVPEDWPQRGEPLGTEYHVEPGQGQDDEISREGGVVDDEGR